MRAPAEFKHLLQIDNRVIANQGSGGLTKPLQNVLGFEGYYFCFDAVSPEIIVLGGRSLGVNSFRRTTHGLWRENRRSRGEYRGGRYRLRGLGGWALRGDRSTLILDKEETEATAPGFCVRVHEL